MEFLSDDELQLKGKIQLDTAIDALDTIGINPSAAEKLQILRTTQQQHAAAFPDEPEQLYLYFKGGKTAAIKADILVGLELLSANADKPEQKIAAQALLEIFLQK
ncbi:MAG: hypothetical protein JWO54_609 [Candidatus Saccharibacteria bacterium]|nr:hypothetical protein [Candidatus Saccharibacteria bacterium]MDB5180849.1 hypothetical protein [Candidatus Saccharibacteria bacterium]